MTRPIKIQLSGLYGQFDKPFKFFEDYINESVSIAKKNGVNITVAEVCNRYLESHRHFHTVIHLTDILQKIFNLYKDKLISDKEFVILIISAIFHDIVYDPTRKDNEEESVRILKEHTTDEIDNEILEESIRVILGTKSHIFSDQINDDDPDKLIYYFNRFDCSILDSDIESLRWWEKQIRKEYYFAPWDVYKERRVKFLNLSLPNHKSNQDNLLSLIKELEGKDE